jgi:hypothetical protein
MLMMSHVLLSDKQNKIALSCLPIYINITQLIKISNSIAIAMSSDYLLRNENHPSSMLDPDNRDPMKINKHLQVKNFEKNFILY